MAKRVNNKEIPECIRLGIEFRNNTETVAGLWSKHGYVVHSYRLSYPIAFWDRETQTWYTHDGRYSVTTNKHMALARQGMGSYITLPSVTDLLAVEAHSYTGAIARKLTQGRPHEPNK